VGQLRGSGSGRCRLLRGKCGLYRRPRTMRRVVELGGRIRIGELGYGICKSALINVLPFALSRRMVIGGATMW